MSVQPRTTRRTSKQRTGILYECHDQWPIYWHLHAHCDNTTEPCQHFVEYFHSDGRTTAGFLNGVEIIRLCADTHEWCQRHFNCYLDVYYDNPTELTHFRAPGTGALIPFNYW